ncbi:MAG: peptidoglycan DD-metalloendopeptidase family protein [Burkholderiaceae bacterium]
MLLTLAVSACTITSIREAPIVEKSDRSGARNDAARALDAAPVAPLQREAKDGTYVVQRGDTLYSIALAFGQDFRDIARWNALDDPSKLAVGKALRVAPPDSEAAAPAVAAAVPIAPSAAVEARPLGAAPALQTPTPLPPPQTAALPAVPAAKSADTAKPAPAAAIDSGLVWQWPAGGSVIAAFDEVRNKGIGIGGNEGDPVVAAGDGQVVYSGSGLRGYGNLVIIKHTDEFISAYAHNRQILVKQGQVVKRGQRIAELGKTDSSVPKLHFEIRQRGKPVDPLKYLPPRP